MGFFIRDQSGFIFPQSVFWGEVLSSQIEEPSEKKWCTPPRYRSTRQQPPKSDPPIVPSAIVPLLLSRQGSLLQLRGLSHQTDISTHLHPAQPVRVPMPPRETTSAATTTKQRYALALQNMAKWFVWPGDMNTLIKRLLLPEVHRCFAIFAMSRFPATAWPV